VKGIIGSLVGGALLFGAATGHAADQIHWTITGPASVTFDWRGTETEIRYGPTAAYQVTVTATDPTPTPWSSPGPFREARLTGLSPDALYHYSIGGGPDHTFRTAPPRGRSDFVIAAEGDIGSADSYPRLDEIQQQVRDQHVAFVLMLGDLTYANSHGAVAVDRHFDDVMAWSQDAAYMPVWGNHEYEGGSYADDLRNYKGRFDLPNPRTSPGSPAVSCCGEDWYWFDYGNVRFIAIPEPWPNAWENWYPRADSLMDEAQRDPAIAFIVTFGHRPAYSSGHHAGNPTIRGYLDALGQSHSKYRLDLSGHSHGYERSTLQSGVVHIVSGGGGANLEEDWSNGCPWRAGCPAPAYVAFRAFRHHWVRLAFHAREIDVDAICGPAVTSGSGRNDIDCTPGTVFDHIALLSAETGSPASSPPGIDRAVMIPSPLRGRGALRLTLAHATRVDAEIVDLGGRVVRRLIGGAELGAGTRELPFDGRDNHGAPLHSGIYFARVRLGTGGLDVAFSLIR